MTIDAPVCNTIPPGMPTTLWFLTTFFAQGIVIFYPGVFAFWFIVHPNIDRLRPWGPRAYLAVAAFAWATTAGPLLLLRSRIFAVSWSLPQPFSGIVAGIGIVTLVLALAIFSQASKQISFRTLIGITEIEPHKSRQPVLDSGIYSKTRNPIYLAHWLLILSAAAVSGYAANWIMFAVDCLVVPLLIFAEERELLARYGRDFSDYMRRVPRFFPQLR